MSRRRPYRKEQRRTVLACALLVLVYFVVPVQPDANGARLAVRAVLTVVAVIVVALLVTGQVRRQLAAERAPAGPGQAPAAAAGVGPAGDDGQARSLAHLAVALVAGLLAFALADYVIAITAPEQFVNLRTRVDALYFALATLTTIGYGDVHAEGQFARSVVAVQMAFSIGVIATGLSLVLKNLTRPKATPPRG
ncbi:ion transporter [Micromonospora rosaria]|uniref:Ion transporter n=1 Tax=Micromonospora rosaria TaxID=47874 RepID=A0A136PNM7_9ACTN|nr:potassium channel family protein [Micromonospora rosaria]KXK60035.1 ion transporter [Micromonospora rosaria]